MNVIETQLKYFPFIFTFSLEFALSAEFRVKNMGNLIFIFGPLTAIFLNVNLHLYVIFQ